MYSIDGSRLGVAVESARLVEPQRLMPSIYRLWTVVVDSGTIEPEAVVRSVQGTVVGQIWKNDGYGCGWTRFGSR